ncbi:unnamed protein product [Amoebophrya sp. A120]|nr:unnamed protein product [Amoebophrya sp. A120]|eukprot:GSA120T00022583001.1
MLALLHKGSATAIRELDRVRKENKELQLENARLKLDAKLKVLLVNNHAIRAISHTNEADLIRKTFAAWQKFSALAKAKRQLVTSKTDFLLVLQAPHRRAFRAWRQHVHHKRHVKFEQLRRKYREETETYETRIASLEQELTAQTGPDKRQLTRQVEALDRELSAVKREKSTLEEELSTKITSLQSERRAMEKKVKLAAALESEAVEAHSEVSRELDRHRASLELSRRRSTISDGFLEARVAELETELKLADQVVKRLQLTGARILQITRDKQLKVQLFSHWKNYAALHFSTSAQQADVEGYKDNKNSYQTSTGTTLERSRNHRGRNRTGLSKRTRERRLPVRFSEYERVEQELQETRDLLHDTHTRIQELQKELGDGPLKDLQRAAQFGGSSARYCVKRFLEKYDLSAVILALFTRVLLLQEEKMRGPGGGAGMMNRKNASAALGNYSRDEGQHLLQNNGKLKWNASTTVGNMASNRALAFPLEQDIIYRHGILGYNQHPEYQTRTAGSPHYSVHGDSGASPGQIFNSLDEDEDYFYNQTETPPLRSTTLIRNTSTAAEARIKWLLRHWSRTGLLESRGDLHQIVQRLRIRDSNMVTQVLLLLLKYPDHESHLQPLDAVVRRLVCGEAKPGEFLAKCVFFNTDHLDQEHALFGFYDSNGAGASPESEEFLENGGDEAEGRIRASPRGPPNYNRTRPAPEARNRIKGGPTSSVFSPRDRRTGVVSSHAGGKDFYDRLVQNAYSSLQKTRYAMWDLVNV